MSAVAITIAALARDTAVTALVGAKIVNIVSEDPPPNILVDLIHETDEDMLDGPGSWYESRVSIDCRSTRPAEVHKIGEAVKAALQPIHLEVFHGYEASFTKDGSDATSFGDEASIARRVLDFSVRWRRLPV